MLNLVDIKLNLLCDTFDGQVFTNRFLQLNTKEQQALHQKLIFEKLDLLIFQFLQTNDRSQLRLFQSEVIREKAFNLLLQSSLNKILKATQDIQLILLKGPILECLTGMDTYKRKADIDILVKLDDLDQTLRQVRKTGFKVLHKRHTFGEFTLRKGDIQFLDVHYNITASSAFIYLFSIDDRIYEETGEYKLKTNPVLSFNLEMTLVHLILHFSINHKMNEFIQLYELMAVFRKQGSEINVDKFINLSIEYNIEHIVYTVIQLLSSFQPLNILTKIITQLDKYHPKLFLNEKHQQMIRQNILHGTHRINELHLIRFYLNSPSKILQYIKGYIFMNMLKIQPFARMLSPANVIIDENSQLSA